MSLISNTTQVDFILLPDQTGGNLGTAATTVDICSNIRINQTSGTLLAPIGIGLFSPTDATTTQYLTLSNVGSGYFAIAGVLVPPGTTIPLYFAGTWTLNPPTGGFDFFRSGSGNGLPDGATDATEKVSRFGQTGFGVGDPTLVGATIDNFGTLTNRSVTVSNALATITLSAAQVDANSTIKIIQTSLDSTVTIAAPVISTAAGRFLRLHNDNTSTRTITYTLPDGSPRVLKPGSFIDLQWNGNVWAGEAIPVGGNIINALSNVTPATVMNVGGLFEIAMPASVDVQIRGLVARQVYILSEGEYPGGSFSTSTAAIVNLTTAFVPADNNVHVAGERNIITIQDVLTNRIFRVTVWRFGAIAGNWSGWVEEIGVATNQIFVPTAKNFVNYTRNATFATATNANIPWTNSNAVSGSEITQSGANFTLTPTGGVTKTYRITFNANYTFNALLGHACDFQLRNPLGTAQTINGVSIASNAYFGQGTTLFATTNGSQEAGSGIIDYTIQTSTPITFCVGIPGQANTPTLGSAGTNRYPTIVVEELSNIYSVAQTPIPLYATNAAAVADVALATGSQYSVLVGGFKQIFVK